MLVPVAGARIFIAAIGGGSVDASTLGSANWVEISEPEAIGMLGERFDLEDAGAEIGGDGRRVLLKSVRNPTPMQVVFGIDLGNPGQLMLFEAYRAILPHYAFRLDFPLMPGQATPARRVWAGMVVAVDEAFEAANAVARLMCEIIPQSEIIRHEAT